MSLATFIAIPILGGIAIASPREKAAKWSLALAITGVTAGAYGLYLGTKGQMDKALKADLISVAFDLLAIKKALEIT